MPRIVLRTEIAASMETCFDLSRDVSVHTGSGGDERAVAGVTTGRLDLGDEVTFEARHLGMRWRMTSRITELERPSRFVDEMTKGPFKRWRHEHLFSATDRGTMMLDDVRYAPMFWPLSWPVDRLFFRSYMRRLLERRNRFLRRQAERSR
jgi:ligand-binding SRPBCC domain-containing protein